MIHLFHLNYHVYWYKILFYRIFFFHGSRGTTSSRVSKFQKVANNLPASVTFICKPVQSPGSQLPALFGSRTRWRATLHLPYSPRARDQKTKDSLMTQRPLKSFRLVTPHPAGPASPVPSHGNYEKTLAHIYFLLLSGS